ncbi:hybrid sensor histidine kinase/response regulator [Alginatibacterium sediminis]|uniref:histidine kinase n=1 Tax=Alginatibacterium sediminis TaxID=2164068 RepID=A0A420E5B5_9ALTE|nr:response regulator [Alginatibacterium sediminis]RKF12766.1 hybrid sensor histidine kinase/response regulator [Alginatibacterium sediminis]
MELKYATVLIVDDMEAMRKINISNLRGFGVGMILEADNGQAALNHMKQRKVDLILSDWSMPVMDGLELLSQIRKNPAWEDIPFVMVTAESERSRVAYAVRSGVSDLLIKPFTLGRLKERVVAALNGEIRNRVKSKELELEKDVRISPNTSSLGSTTQRSVLIVDDVADNLTLLAGLLKKDYRILLAKDGLRALSLCQSETPPDLVLLDVMMPGMDGFEVLKRMREHPASEQIPVIFVSALGDVESQSRGLGGGAVDYITKPVQPELLKLRVKNLMQDVRMRQNLQDDYQQMLENQKLKDDVEQILHHDLKGPMAGIFSLAEQLLANPRLPSAVRDSLEMIEDLSTRSLDMVNNTAELYKIESGSYTLKPEKFSLLKLLERLLKTLDSTYKSKGLQFEIKNLAGEHSKVECYGDESLSQSALFNLFKNACEASPVGGKITARLDIKVDHIEFGIYNSGVVPEDIRDKFWRKYVSSGKNQGTGLGTYSAKLMIEAQKGQIEMQTDDSSDLTRILISLPFVI